MKKKFGIGILAVLIVLIGLYFKLSRTTSYEIDKSVIVETPTSAKSQPETYEFGFQPDLEYSESRKPCAAQYPLKKAFFGDLHIHTALSADAFPDGTRTFPDDAYKFAKGEAVDMPVADGSEPMSLQLARPLDFASVTDHAETYGEGHICRTPGAYPGYDSKACQIFRKGGSAGVRIFMSGNSKINPSRNADVCGENEADCKAADKIVWQDTIRAAEDAYDRSSDCNFTSFVGYEYTRSPNATHMHRNTIFKNASVPDLPATFFDHPQTHLLLTALETDCRAGIDACDVISIPHNSNISGGNAFSIRAMDGFSEAAQKAHRTQRNSFDRLMEITQHKGTSECLNRVTDILGDVDELCNVEAIRQIGKKERAVDTTTQIPRLYSVYSEECSDDNFDETDNLYKDFCLSSRDFARGALLTGMEQEHSHGINPFEFGFIGSSDTHISAAGHVTEPDWSGHIAYETNLEGRLGDAKLGRFNRLVSNPGGLAGGWASENSRDALFQGMKRREAFATSGPRIEPRFFAGHFSAELCSQPDWLEQAYAKGTPMGSKLPAQNKPFQLLVSAQRDKASYPLEKLQIVKGWIDSTQKHNAVFDVAIGEGEDRLCSVFSDPDYDPDQPTYYYMRAVEPESQRWSQFQCEALPVDKRPKGCENNQPAKIREMAWTSPIWFTPMPDAP